MAVMTILGLLIGMIPAQRAVKIKANRSFKKRIIHVNLPFDFFLEK